ncbi:hypothetical protein THRCLA_01210 [Thraustotheca clavata]|uniref:Myb-like domain-containing protein n=1 Tax=Thraustotheca clavata TaxID=74557 RepID=A0A1W0A973_9STRA|nr:hypothetical protein THRCLA_01210 [Thraustotheca clavata]
MVDREYKGYTRGRNSGAVNFLEEEDVVLAKVWAEVMSEDEGVQMLILWPRVARKFRTECEKKAIPNHRNPNSLRNRFLTLQHSFSKYVPCLQKALETHRPGWALSNYEKEARSLFLRAHGKRFKHELAYNELRHAPKFSIDLDLVPVEVRETLNLDAMFAYHDPNEPDGFIPTGNGNQSPTIVRPMSKRLKVSNDENETEDENDTKVENQISSQTQKTQEPQQAVKLPEKTTGMVMRESNSRLQQYMQNKLLQSLPKESIERRAIEQEMAKSMLLDIQIANATKTIKLNELKKQLADQNDNDVPMASEDTEDNMTTN